MPSRDGPRRAKLGGSPRVVGWAGDGLRGCGERAVGGVGGPHPRTRSARAIDTACRRSRTPLRPIALSRATTPSRRFSRLPWGRLGPVHRLPPFPARPAASLRGRSSILAASVVTLAFLACPAAGLCQEIGEADVTVDPEGEGQNGEEAPVYDANKPIPAGYVLHQEPRRGLLIAGSATLGASYGYSLLIAIWTKQRADRVDTFSPGWLLIPVLGPWIAAATAHDQCGYEGVAAYRYYYCRRADEDAKYLAVLGGIQAVGLALGVAAYRFPSRRLLRSDLSVSLLPIGRTGYGLGLSGRL